MDAMQKIIEATIECIEEYGIKDTTIRRIGEKANMNSAAINYYFRSKDKLVEHVMLKTLDNAFDWNDFRHTEHMPLKEQLIEIYSFYALSIMKYPKLTQAHFYDIVVNGKNDSPAAIRLNELQNRIFEEFKRKRNDMADEEIRLTIMQMTTSTILFFPFFSSIYEKYSGIDMSNPDNRIAYVKSVVERFFK